MIKIDFNPPKNQLLQFGWIALIGFPLVGVMLHYVAGILPMTGLWIFVGLGVAMGLSALIKADVVIKPIYIGMMVLAFPIGMVLSTVMLGLIYFGMFTPVSLIFKAMGRDLLHRRPDPEVESYWNVRETQRAPASYLRLY